ncbi:RIB43A-like with coiled-coils protein 1 [Clarias gariepinus]|uniref:RIB43A-like with coiled-coils protein 1 n=1 Tax=Clarias gariepinus TaxID=13013 RepID=UPI00234DC087|nr:RIB43A-like with coiled-coils protein 1 [Clarias gariepinus]
MFKFDQPVDESSRSAVERRQAAEAERRKRIFNPRNRVIGLDVHALEQQVTERRKREEVERQQKLVYDTLCISTDQKLIEQDRKEDSRRRELAQDLVQYWATYQRSEDSRDADINYNHQGGASVSSVNQDSLGPASMQVFQGEGVGENERRKNQIEENERILRAQREEREKWKNEQKHKELLRDLEMIQQDQRALQLDALEEECKKAAHMALKSYNQAQAEERQEQERQNKQTHEALNMAEILQMVTSDLLTECPEAAVKEGMGSPEAPQVLPDRWKGMSSEQLEAIHRQRAEQCAERERQRQQEKQNNLEWGWQQLKQARQHEEEERRVRELERERRTRLDQYNQQLAREQQAHQEYLNNELYTNRPTVRYFSQFNTTTR